MAADDNDALKHVLAELKEIRKGQEELRQGQETQGQELKELRQGQDTLIERVGNVEQGQETQGQELKGLHKDLTKLAAHVEGRLTDQIQVLFDARKQTQNSLDRIEEKLDRQDQRLDLHWQEIVVLKTKRR